MLTHEVFLTLNQCLAVAEHLGQFPQTADKCKFRVIFLYCCQGSNPESYAH